MRCEVLNVCTALDIALDLHWTGSPRLFNYLHGYKGMWVHGCIVGAWVRGYKRMWVHGCIVGAWVRGYKGM